MTPEAVAEWKQLGDRSPAYALVRDVDLVIIRHDDAVSVFYGRCLHRGALLADGFIRGDNLICPVHDWDYRYDSGVSEYSNDEALNKFAAWVEDGQVWGDADACPVGIATQKPHLVSRLVVEQSAERLKSFLEGTVSLMKTMARACGHTHLAQLSTDDLTTWKPEMGRLAGVRYGGLGG